MKFKLSAFKKYLSICSIIALQAGLTTSSFAAIVASGTTNPSPPASHTYWYYPNIIIGGATGNTSVMVDNTSYIHATTLLTIGTTSPFDSTLTLQGARTRLTANRIEMIGSRSFLNVLDGSAFQTQDSFTSEGTTLIRGVNWTTNGDIILNGLTSQQRSSLQAEGGSLITTRGDMSLTNANLSLLNSYIELHNTSPKGALFMSNSNFSLSNGSQAHFKGGVIGQNSGTSLISLSGQSRLSFSDPLTIGAAGNGQLRLSSDSYFQAPHIDIAVNPGTSGGISVLVGDPNNIGFIDVPTINFGAGSGYITFQHNIDSTDSAGIKQSANAYQFSSSLTGNADIPLYGGDTAISGDWSGLTGRVEIYLGTLFITPNATMANTIDFDVYDRNMLNFDGGTQTIGHLANYGGHISFGDGLDAVITMNSYTASGLSSMAMESGFINKPGLTDKMIVLGDTAGTTYLRVRDVERSGAEGDDGIEIIEVRGQSNGNFILMGDFTLPDGQQAVAHGAYAYTLQRGANTARAFGANNWYMRRAGGTEDGGQGNGGGGGNEVIYQPGVSIYEAYPQALMELGRVSSLDEREGDKTYLGQGLAAGDAQSLMGNPSFWTALEGRHLKIASGQTKTHTSYKQNAIKMKAGVDVPVYEDAAGRLVVGASVHYVHGKTDTRGSHHYGEGDIKTTGFGVTPTVTWYGADGFYADGQAMITLYESDMKADKINFPLANENKSTGYAFSAEIGQKLKLQGNWGATLQGQLVYSGVNFNTFKDTIGAAVIEHDHGESLRARIGGKIDYTTHNDNARMNYFAGINIYNQFLKAPQVSVYDSFGMDPVAFKGVKEKVSVGIVGGMSHSWADDKYKLYGMVGASSPFSGFGDSYTARANVGVKIAF